MGRDPRVSTVVIFLNEERFLTEALESVLAQSYTDWELLLVDDGSVDGSTAIARRFAERYPGQVRYLEHPEHANRGMSASRNLAIGHARGELISYLDGDDVWLPNKLEEQVRLIDAHPEVAFVYGPLRVWYSWTGNPDDRAREYLYGLGARGIHPHKDSVVEPPRLVSLMVEDQNFIPGGILVKRAALEAVGGYVESFRGSFEDAVVLVKLCLSFRVYVSSTCWYKYRQHGDSWTKRSIARGGWPADKMRFVRWVESYLAHARMDDPGVRKALRRAIRRLEHPRLAAWLDFRGHLFAARQFVFAVGRRFLPTWIQQHIRAWMAADNPGAGE